MEITSKLKKVARYSRCIISKLKYRVLSAVGHSKFKRFVVLSRSRTGSNMLISLLNSHPNINVEGEIFGRLNGQNYNKVLSVAFGKQSRHIKAKGFKIFYYHPIDDPESNIWNDLVNMDELHVIHLKRRNILRTLISRKLAATSDVWQTTNSSAKSVVDSKQVFFTVEELVEGFEETRQWEKNGEEMFKGHNVLSIYYEDLVDDAESSFNELSNFLDVDYIKLETNLKKQNPEKIFDLISNYEELREYFSGTEWQIFFEESETETETE